MNIEIRRPKANDKEALKALFIATIDDIFEREAIDMPELKLEEIDEKQTFFLDDLESNGQKRYFLIAEIDGKVVGTAAIGPSNPLIHESSGDKLKEILEIGTVYVHPNYQKHGVGMKLMRAIYLTLLARGEREFCLDSGYKSAQAIWTRKIGPPEYIDADRWGEGNPHMVWHKSLDDVKILM